MESQQSSGFPHVAPALQALHGDALQLWGDAAERRAALEAVLRAWETGNPNLGALVARIDAAVEAGLRALGLPRGPVRGVRIEDFDMRWFGRKHPDSTLLIDGNGMRQMILARGQPDSIFRTWIHESLHARQPYTPTSVSEYRDYCGYEEGMVEGLTRSVVLVGAGIDAAPGPFDYYVEAYRSLAVVVGLDVEAIWRDLWMHPMGAVRSVLPAVVDQRWRDVNGPGILQRERLMGVANRLFSRTRRNDMPDSAMMAALWRTVLE